MMFWGVCSRIEELMLALAVGHYRRPEYQSAADVGNMKKSGVENNLVWTTIWCGQQFEAVVM